MVRVFDPNGWAIFQAIKVYNGAGAETITAQLAGGVPFRDGPYVTSIWCRPELYLVESIEWTVGGLLPRAYLPVVVRRHLEGEAVQYSLQTSPLVAPSRVSLIEFR
jgi:hypothetical protein